MRFHVRKVAWSLKAETHLKDAEIEPGDLAHWKLLVKAGRLTLLGVYAGARRKRCGSVIMNLSGMPRELVYVAAGGRWEGRFIYPTLLPSFCEIAESMGAKSIRCHAARKGVGRWLQGVGFREQERVYRLYL